MKTLKSLLYVFLASFLFAGCSDDKDFNTGGPEDPDCYNVYFPTQENIGSKELDPAAPTELAFTVRRLKSEGAITVPVTIDSSAADVFAATEIEFADGQEETSFSVVFPTAEIGTTYKCEVNIEDNKYAAVYGEKATGFAFSVTRVKWNLVTGEGGETKGKWRDDVISSMFNVANANAEVDVEIYERADKPGYYRMNPYTQTLIRALFNGTAQACTEPNIIIDATNPNAVWMPYQTTGVTLGGDGEIEIASKVSANFSSVSESASLYGTLKDGIISFPAAGIMVNFTILGGWYGANSSGLQRIMLPGAKAYDYTLSLTNTEPAAGVVKVGFKFGADVAKVKYAFFNGTMSDALADVRSDEIESGETPSTEITASGTVSASFDDTGIYSVVGNMYNAAGELVGRSYLSFGYVAAGDEKPVILNVHAQVTWEYAADGYTPENSVQGIVYGQDIESGYAGIFKSQDIAGMSDADLMATVKKSGTAFTEEQLGKINDKGLSTLYTDLAGGTDYTLLICAFNGYYSKVFSAMQATQGKPDPLQIHYMYDDADGLNKADYCKTWDYYAVDVYDDDGNTSRQYFGKVSITDGGATSGYADFDAVYNSYVKVTGLTGAAGAFNDGESQYMAWSNGMLYVLGPQLVGNVTLQSKNYYVNVLYGNEENTSVYSGRGLLLGAKVADGLVAFVPNPGLQASNNMTFTGMWFGIYTGYDASTNTFSGSLGGLLYYKWLLLADPTMYPASTVATIAKSLSVRPENYVELRGPELVKVLMDEQDRLPANRGKNAVAVEMPDLGVANATATFSEGVVPASSASSFEMVGKKVSMK